jgi:choice-of-anchor B domain-containing protein
MKRSIPIAVFCIALVGIASIIGSGSGGGGGTSSPVVPNIGGGPADCDAGRADGFSCNAVALAKRVTLATLGGTTANDIWGWTDSADGAEYALVGVDNGTAFVRVSDPENPTVVGYLRTQTSSSHLRDIKVYMNHAYIVADSAGAHGMQVFDLTRLRGGGTGQIFSADVVYGDFEEAHNIAINESSGFAYIVGSETCSGGLHMVDIRQPLNPLFAGCHSIDGYTHDAQCVNYVGPDPDYMGSEICFNSNEDSLAIADVTVKASPITLASLVYPDLGYVHQAWLDDTHQYLVVNDELDEFQLGLRTGTIVIDVTDLDNPKYLYTHRHTTSSTDHNLYVSGNRIYEANYTSGLRILEFTSLATDTLTEVGFFDTYPLNDDPGIAGAWSVYPFFPSGTVVVSDIDNGLFVLSPN